MSTKECLLYLLKIYMAFVNKVNSPFKRYAQIFALINCRRIWIHIFYLDPTS